MTNIWNYKLPYKSYEKKFKYTFKSASKTGCTIFDLSYIKPITVIEPNIKSLLSTFKIDANLNNVNNVNLVYNDEFIGPAEIILSQMNSLDHIQLYIHPSIYLKITNILQSLKIEFLENNDLVRFELRGPTTFSTIKAALPKLIKTENVIY